MSTDPVIVDVKLTHRTPKGTLIRSPARLEYRAGRIYFLKSPFALKDEIKAMKGSKWHGFDEENPKKIWSVSDCQRNRFQLAFLMGEDVYEWFDRPLVNHDYSGTTKWGEPAELMVHQCDLADHGLTYHFCIWAAEMGTGKTLAAQKVIEKSGVKHWYWVGPKSSLPNMRIEFRMWGFDFDGDIQIEFMTYEHLVKLMDNWVEGDPIPQGVIFDESSRMKGHSSQRTSAGQFLADKIRERYGFDGYVIEMSGTPSPKSPADWWAQCEIAWPGFLREGSHKAMEQRLAFMVNREFGDGVHKARIGWKDDERKCAVCGLYEDAGQHFYDPDSPEEDVHRYEPSVNEVALLSERLSGLVIVKHKKDCINLPDKRYTRAVCKPSSSVLRVAKALKQAAPNTITGLTWLRELSDGFQYKNTKIGMTRCTHCKEGKVFEWFRPNTDITFRSVDMLLPEEVERLERREVPCPNCNGTCEVPQYTREVRDVPCPKDKELFADLERSEEVGRIVVFAGFTGAIDRIVKLCHKKGWDTVRLDGRGYETHKLDGTTPHLLTSGGEESLMYWKDVETAPRVAFVAHPESGGMSLTLTESRLFVFWSNSFKPEYRSQAEDRGHRKGMDENVGVEIRDYIHLPTDERVLQVIRDNRRLELMTMGEFDLDGVQYSEAA